MIVVSDSPEIGFHGQSALETALLADLGEVYDSPNPGGPLTTHQPVETLVNTG